MKRLIFSVFALLGILFPLLSQVDHDYLPSEKIPVESLVLKKEQIPPSIITSVGKDFSSGKALTYGKFPFALEKYGWVINKESANEKPDHYEVFIKANDGGDVYAVYKSDGTLVQSRAIYKDIRIPASVQEGLNKSQYKDWTIIGDKEIVKYYNTKSNIEEHFRLTVEKNNVKRTISFNYKEPAK